MNKDIYDRINGTMREAMIPGIKRFLKASLKERSGKRQDEQGGTTLMDDWTTIANYYQQSCKDVIQEIDTNMQLSGITLYSGYKEVVEDDE